MSSHKHQYFEPVIAKEEDGSVQLTFTIPWDVVKSERDHVATHMGEGITIPGFRPGKAPLDAVIAHIPQDRLISETVGHIMPHLLTEAYDKNDINPVMYPKVSLISAEEGSDWQIRAITAQMPEIKLGDYKKEIKGELSKEDLWKPGEDEKKKELTAQQKEDIAVRKLVEICEVNLPKVLIEEEANHRLSQLLSRLESLGLTLENYLSSQGKSPEDIRAEYAQTAATSLKLELILGKIAVDEKVSVSDEEISAFSKAVVATQGKEREMSSEEITSIRTILTKRKVLELLVA